MSAHEVVDLSAMDSGEPSGSDGGHSGKVKAEKRGSGGAAAASASTSNDDAEARKQQQRARAAERKREKRAEARQQKEKEAQARANDAAAPSSIPMAATDKLPPLRVAINSPGMGWLQPVKKHSHGVVGGVGGASASDSGSGSGSGSGKVQSPGTAAKAAAMAATAEASAVAAAASFAAASPEASARVDRVAAAADALAAKVSSGVAGGGGAGAYMARNVGGPWAHAAGMKSVHAGGGGAGAGAGAATAAAADDFFGRNSGPMCPQSVRMLLADPERSKILISNMLAERTREVESAKRKRDQLLGERKRLARDRSKAAQRHQTVLERRRQPVLPVDDALLGNLKPVGGEEAAPTERPPMLKKLSIAAGVSGSILRAWDFLHLNAQMITLTPFGLDDFADSLHYTKGESVMVAEVHTRLLSVILRDGKFPKNLSAALDPAAAGDVPAAASSVFVGAAARAAAAAAAVGQVTSKLGAGKAGSSKKGLMGSPSGKGKGAGSVSRSNHRPRRTGKEEQEEEEEGEGEDREEASIMALLPPRSERNEQHDNAYNLVTALTWQTVLALALPHMAPYARAVAPSSMTLGSTALCLAAAPAGTVESKRGSKVAIQAAERVEAARVARGKALMRARRSLLEMEYCTLPLEEKALLLEVLVDAAYETKRMRSMLAENMAARMSLESQRREEIIVYNRELREKATAQKAKVHARLRKANEELYLKRVAASEKDKAKRAAELGLVPAAAADAGPATVVANGTADTATPAPAPAPAAPADSNGNGNDNGNGIGNGSRSASPTPGAAVSAGAGADGATVKGKGKGKKGKGKAAEGGGLLKVNPKIFEPDRGQLQSGILEDTVWEAVGGDFKLRSIAIPDDDVDPFEAEQVEADKAAKKLMLENLSRTELIQRRREKDAKDKERNKRRQEWKDSRLQRMQQARALQSLKSAVTEGDVELLEEAIKEGKKTLLEEEDDEGVRFLCPEMRDAYVALSNLRERTGREEILSRYEKLMAEKFVRTEPLGTDRHGRRYWMFEGDSRIHVEIITRKKDIPEMEDTTTAGSAIESEAAAAADQQENGTSTGETANGVGKGKAIAKSNSNSSANAAAEGDAHGATSAGAASASSHTAGSGSGSRSGSAKGGQGKEQQQALVPARAAKPHPHMEAYHPVWSESVWMYYDTPEEFHKLILSLDPRGKREGELRQALQEKFDMAELERDANVSLRDSSADTESRHDDWREEGSEFLGKRVKRVFGRRVAGATVVKWIPKESNQGLALWHLRHDDGDEEDLEEFEVREGMAMHEAEEEAQQRSCSASCSSSSSPSPSPSSPSPDGESKVSTLLKTAVEGSLTTTFTEYMNRLNKMQAIKERDLGVSALQEALLHREAGMLDDIKDRTRDYAKGTNAATPRGVWLRLVKDAAGISDVKEAILMLEETLRGLQEGEDKVEGGRMELEAKGWNFSPEAHPLIGKRCRRFFKEFGKSDCTVAAHLPAKSGDPELWHVVHDDGDEEDLEEHELTKAREYLDEDVEEMPPDDDEEKEDDDEVDDDGSQDDNAARDAEEEEDDDDEEEDSEDEEGPESSRTQSRATLWENWGARQGWVKGIKAAKTVATLALGFLTLVETAYLFGVGKESMLEANRSRARMAKAWETPGKSRNSSKRAASMTASEKISSFAADMDVDEGSSPSATATGTGKRRSSRGEGGGGSADKRQRR